MILADVVVIFVDDVGVFITDVEVVISIAAIGGAGLAAVDGCAV